MPPSRGISAMQLSLANAVQRCVPSKRADVRASWRVTDVVSGKQPPCATLERIIDERIALGASDDAVLDIANVFRYELQQKLARRAGRSVVLPFEHVNARETEAQAALDIAQMASIRDRSPSALHRVKVAAMRHAGWLRDLIHAADHEQATREDLRRVAQARLNLGRSA